MSEAAPHPIVAVVLAAGHGSRMLAPERHKVTLPICGRPVIRHAVETYHACGAERCVVVVGVMEDQVREALAGVSSQIEFCRQEQQRGTVHAARTGAAVLRSEGYDGDILVVAGDKVLARPALERLIAAFRRESPDMAFITGRASDYPSSGRLVLDPTGRPCRIVEVADINRARLLEEFRTLSQSSPLPAETVLRMASAAFGSEAKGAKAVGNVWTQAMSGAPLKLSAIPPPDQDALAAENAGQANLSVYLFKATVLYAALDAIGSDNAQGEEYLTDAVAIVLARGGSTLAVPVENPVEVMAFNTPEEYLRVRRCYEGMRGGSSGPLLTPVSAWLESATNTPALRLALEAFAQRYGDLPVCVSRAPGRLNLMGRHVDHQGGAGNLIALDRATYMVMAPRTDRRVNLHSPDPRFPDRSFELEVLPPGAASDWFKYVSSAAVSAATAELLGDWSLYIRAAAARLEAEAGRPIAGMDISVAGDIPIAAGLSSSSALVVAAAEGILALNNIACSRERLVELCGEAEWYVGTRGGAGDHAAMILAREGYVTQVGYFPFRVTGSAPLLRSHTFVVFDTGIPARKTAEAKAMFNQRVACYNVGRALLSVALSGARIEHLRDATAANLGITPAELIRLLKALPEALSFDEARSILRADVASAFLDSISDGETLPIRGVVVFGFAECARAEQCLELLRAGDLKSFGEWMTHSHNGDRVVSPARYADADMDAWIALAEAGDPRAPMELQPGAYGCSTPEIDRMVDIALSVPGVLGAQLSGAGLGGCMMVLAEDSALDAQEAAMLHRYYEPAAIGPGIIRCRPVGGSGLVTPLP